MTTIISKRNAPLLGALFLFGAGSSLQAAPTSDYSRVPLYFEINRGQVAPEVTFVVRGLRHQMFLTANGAVMALPSADRPLRMSFVGANPAPCMRGLDQQPGKVNYLRGASSGWRTDIPTYARVEYGDVYPGIDLVYYANRQRLEYDFIVAPGRDPGVIAWAFDGAERVALSADGSLELSAMGSTIAQLKPVIYQQVGDRRETIEAHYVLRGPHEVGLAIGPYDASRPLVIDPTLAFSTYLGGSGSEVATRVVVDGAGNAYLTGGTYSLDFPTVNATPIPGGVEDTFVLKLSADGSTLLYATYFGGSQNDTGTDMAIGPGGRLYISGATNSPDFPTRNAIQPAYGGGGDGFLVQLDVSGDNLIYSTYLGGSLDDGASGIAVDSLGNAFVTGETASPDFPTVNAFQRRLNGTLDAFVTELNPTGTALVFSTYLGGNDQSFIDGGTAIAVDAQGNIYVIGTTGSHNFPTRKAFQNKLKGSQDAFLAKFAPGGASLLFSTYLGGDGLDAAYGIAVDSSGRATIVGDTNSTDLPTTSAAQPGPGGGVMDGFVAQFTTDGSALRFCTYLGGSDLENAQGIALDAAGTVYVTGRTYSLDFPVANAIQPASAGNSEVFVTRLAQNGAQFVFSTYLGGEGYDEGSSVATDGAGNLFVTGFTASFGFPVVNPIHATLNGFGDMFLARITP